MALEESQLETTALYLETPELPITEELVDDSEHRDWRRFLRPACRLALAGIAMASSGLAGITLTDTPVQVGPHTADARLTFNGFAVINSEPEQAGAVASSLAIPVQWPAGAGASLTFHDL